MHERPADRVERGGSTVGLLWSWRAMLVAAGVAGLVVGLLVPAPSGLSQWQLALVCALAAALGTFALVLAFERCARCSPARPTSASAPPATAGRWPRAG